MAWIEAYRGLPAQSSGGEWDSSCGTHSAEKLQLKRHSTDFTHKGQFIRHKESYSASENSGMSFVVL